MDILGEKKVLRIVLTQSSANYRKEGSHTNKMTYPLPPLSTVIGAIHNACGYTEYHEMDISIQGNYESISREVYTDYAFLNNTMDDRGILVKMLNPNLLSCGYIEVARALKSQGNSFKNGKTVMVVDEKLMEEYLELWREKDSLAEYKKTVYDSKIDEYKKIKKEISAEKKGLNKKSDEYKEILLRESLIKAEEIEFKDEYDRKKQSIESNLSMYRSLTKSIKSYEILSNIKLVIHVRSDEATIEDIKNNIYNMKSIGRSEDFVNVEECEYANIKNLDDDETSVGSKYCAYLNLDDVRDDKIILSKVKEGVEITGTVYYIDKDYRIEDNKRVFKKKKVIYASGYSVDEDSEIEDSDRIFIDCAEREIDRNIEVEKYIVNFI